MDWSDALKVVGAIGGVATVSGAVAAFVGNLVSTRIIQQQKAKLDEQLETHKDSLMQEADRRRLLLKRQEMLFEREYSAAADFFRMFASFIPAPWAPGLDWSDVKVRIAENLFSHETELSRFLAQHAAALSQDARHLLEAAKCLANEGGYEVAQESNQGDYEPGCYPSATVCKIVDKFYENLRNAEERIYKDLEHGSFSSTRLS